MEALPSYIHAQPKPFNYILNDFMDVHMFRRGEEFRRWSRQREPLTNDSNRNAMRSEFGEITVKDFLKYCIPPCLLLQYGYPVEFDMDRSQTLIFSSPKTDSTWMNFEYKWVYKKFISSVSYLQPYRIHRRNLINFDGMLRGQYMSTICLPYFFYYPSYRPVKPNYKINRDCVRCRKIYQTSLSSGEPVQQEICLYHWGKLTQDIRDARMVYTCCGSYFNSVGCTRAESHVWDGLIRGKLNGPFSGFVTTRPHPMGLERPILLNDAVVGLDCEMCFTSDGFDACKVTIVDVTGYPVYNSFIQPDKPIIDYNTRFSGVSEKDFNTKSEIPIKSLKTVQEEISKLIYCDTIIVGHGLENDLRVLKMIHKRVIDTALVFPHYFGLPYRRSLKSLALNYLNRQIQNKLGGHDSREDAKACLDLMVWKIRNDLVSS